MKTSDENLGRGHRMCQISQSISLHPISMSMANLTVPIALESVIPWKALLPPIAFLPMSGRNKIRMTLLRPHPKRNPSNEEWLIEDISSKKLTTMTDGWMDRLREMSVVQLEK